MFKKIISGKKSNKEDKKRLILLIVVMVFVGVGAYLFLGMGDSKKSSFLSSSVKKKSFVLAKEKFYSKGRKAIGGKIGQDLSNVGQVVASSEKEAIVSKDLMSANSFFEENKDIHSKTSKGNEFNRDVVLSEKEDITEKEKDIADELFKLRMEEKKLELELKIAKLRSEIEKVKSGIGTKTPISAGTVSLNKAKTVLNMLGVNGGGYKGYKEVVDPNRIIVVGIIGNNAVLKYWDTIEKRWEKREVEEGEVIWGLFRVKSIRGNCVDLMEIKTKNTKKVCL